MANYWAQRKAGPPTPDLILCSTALRARETLLRVMGAWPSPPAVAYERELYLCGEEALLDRLRRLPATHQRVMLVAHNPDLQCLARDLCGEGDARQRGDLAIKLPTCSFVEIALPADSGWQGLDWGRCRLVDFVPPRDLSPDGQRL